MEVTGTGAEVSVFVACVVGEDATATVVVAFVVVEEVQPALRRPQSTRLSWARDVRMEGMICRRIPSASFAKSILRSPYVAKIMVLRTIKHDFFKIGHKV